jgi:uncharacterized protein (UPF0548 family)
LISEDLMYSLIQPTPQTIRRFLAEQQPKPFSYAEVGASYSKPPLNYTIDHNRICLGQGQEVFERAKAAMRRWEMFKLGWVQLCWADAPVLPTLSVSTQAACTTPDAPLEVGTTVGVLAWALGLWSLNACRIVYLLEEQGEVERFGFAYGTLLDHIERGEERFSLEWRHQDDSVWYDILAFSRPNQLLSHLAYPYVRRLQKRFAQDSRKAMLKAAGNILPSQGS